MCVHGDVQAHSLAPMHALGITQAQLRGRRAHHSSSKEVPPARAGDGRLRAKRRVVAHISRRGSGNERHARVGLCLALRKGKGRRGHASRIGCRESIRCMRRGWMGAPHGGCGWGCIGSGRKRGRRVCAPRVRMGCTRKEWACLPHICCSRRRGRACGPHSGC